MQMKDVKTEKWHPLNAYIDIKLTVWTVQDAKFVTNFVILQADSTDVKVITCSLT